MMQQFYFYFFQSMLKLKNIPSHGKMTHIHVFMYNVIAKLSPGMRKTTICILTRSDTNQAVQLLEMARGSKFCI